MEDTTKHQGLRRQLIEILQEKGISSAQVLQVMSSIPRHFFMDPGFRLDLDLDLDRKKP